jgi:uncharacterized membrane protein
MAAAEATGGPRQWIPQAPASVVLRCRGSPLTGEEAMRYLLADSMFTRNGLGNFGFRWLHILAGITWIGLLYYFNFVQVPAFAAFGDEGKARNIALDRVARRALWWFRWAALATFLTGILITGIVKDYWEAGTFYNTGIGLGMLLGTIMFLNVWGVIWRKQKVVLANAVNVLGGGEVDPNAAPAGRVALMASRQNTIFSVSMLWFMIFRSHSPYSPSEFSGGDAWFVWIVALVIIAVLQVNALGLMPWKTAVGKGLNWMYESVQNALISAFGLWVIFLILFEITAA